MLAQPAAAYTFEDSKAEELYQNAVTVVLTKESLKGSSFTVPGGDGTGYQTVYVRHAASIFDIRINSYNFTPAKAPTDSAASSYIGITYNDLYYPVGVIHHRTNTRTPPSSTTILEYTPTAQDIADGFFYYTTDGYTIGSGSYKRDPGYHQATSTSTIKLEGQAVGFYTRAAINKLAPGQFQEPQTLEVIESFKLAYNSSSFNLGATVS